MSITLAEAKAHIRVEHDEDNDYITTLISVAYAIAENYTNSIIQSAEKIDKLDDFSSKITLRHSPVQSITSITYYDANDTQQTQTDYFLDDRNLEATIEPIQDDSFPSTNCNFENVVITYQAGYSTIPTNIDHAVLMILGSLYDQRENHSNINMYQIPLSAEYLLNPYRVVKL